MENKSNQEITCLSDALSAVIGEIAAVGIQKTVSINSDKFGYKARGIEDICKVIPGIMAKYQISLTFEQKEFFFQNDALYILVEYFLHYKGEIFKYSTMGEAPILNSGKYRTFREAQIAQTYAYKSFLSQAFLISEGWDEQTMENNLNQNTKDFKSNVMKDRNTPKPEAKTETRNEDIDFDLRADEVIRDFKIRISQTDNAEEIVNIYNKEFKSKVNHPMFPHLKRLSFFELTLDKGIILAA